MVMRRALPLVLALAACAPQPPPERTNAVDPAILQIWKNEFHGFAAALLLLNSPNPADRTRGLDRAAAMAPYQYWSDDQQLIARARAGDAAAAQELARRGEVLDAVQAIRKPYDRLRWESARRRIVSKGDDMAAYLSQILVSSLLLNMNQEIYREIRFELGAIGEEARRTVAGVLAEKIDRAVDMPIGRWEEITQLAAALLAFGEAGRQDFQAVAGSRKRYVRVCAARAVREARAIERADVLAKLLEDPEWEVRAAAAEALGDLRAREQSWRPLMEALSKERDARIVLPKIIIALGRSSCAEAVPKLINALDVPSEAVGNAAAEALYDITAERINTTAGWKEWYRTKYAAWRARQPK